MVGVDRNACLTSTRKTIRERSPASAAVGKCRPISEMRKPTIRRTALKRFCWSQALAIAVIAFAALHLFAIPARPEQLDRITRLKDLGIGTTLGQSGLAKTVIVLPDDGRLYAGALRTIQNRIAAFAGVELPVIYPTEDPERMLSATHVIALGNMATNAFIKSLYMKWFAFLDLKYPGDCGYVVRSVHDPFGTGKNVILIGGSDETGVEKAASAFAGKLKPGNPLTVGWLLEVQLGAGIAPPTFSVDADAKNILSWRDSRRGAFSSDDPKSKFGYEPATYFGWNPISVAGVLYLMTGMPEYLDAFKKLSMPDARRPPKRLMTDDAFEDPKDPLVKSYHYRAHLVDLVWDLMEESPLISDAERLHITNKLLRHQIELDPTHAYTKSNPDRHALYHMLCVYTGSRYFAKSYPDKVWDRRMENVREGFRSLIGDPTWGTRDTLSWVATSTEPIVDFFMLDRLGAFISSGTLQTMAGALDILYSGKAVDEYNKFVPISLLNKTAFLLGDMRYAWMARKLGFDYSRFRIGQSFWPVGAAEDHNAADLIYDLKAFPLARTDWEKAGQTIPLEQGFQIASYRSGLGPEDDYLLFDGFAGLGRDRYHLSAIKNLRLFGETVLSGYENDVDIRKNGLYEPAVPRAAALKESFSNDRAAYLLAEVPDMPGARWKRHALLLEKECFLVVDEVAARADGAFDINIGWRFGAKIDPATLSQTSLVTKNGIRVQTSWAPFRSIDAHNAAQSVHRTLIKGESDTAMAYFAPRNAMTTLGRIAPNTCVIRGRRQGLVSTGPAKFDGFEIAAGFAYVDTKRILLVDAMAFRIDSHTVFASSSPCLVFWDLISGEVSFACHAASRITLGASPARHFYLAVGESRYSGIMPADGHIQSFLAEVERLPLTDAPGKLAPHEVFPPSQWTKAWQIPAPGRVTAIERCPQSPATVTYVATESNEKSSVVSITADGATHARVNLDTEVLTLRPAATRKQADHFAFLIGCWDDTLQAYDARGSLQWAVKTEPDPSFRVGERFQAPWFTDPNPPRSKQGIRTILTGDIWNTGKERIVAGRPSTVAAYSLAGQLIGSSPVHWGDVSAMAVINQANDPGQKVLLVAKDPAGNPALTAIDERLTNISDAYMKSTLPEYTDMHAWLQRGAPDMLAADLDGNGSQEVVYTLSGHWNEIRAYDAATQKALWMHYMGPAESNSPFMRGLALTDLDGDGKKEVATGTQDGWLLVFGHDGAVAKRKKFAAGVAALAADDSGRHLSIGLDDGRILLCEPNFSLMDRTDRPVTVLQWSGEDLYAGGAGYVTKYSMH